MSELLHQALIAYVIKYHPILRTVVIQQVVDPVDGLGTKLDPLASDKDGGVNLKSQIGVELPHYRGHSRDRGRTKCLPAVVLDSKVEEWIGGGETSFREEQAIEQRLVIDSLGLPRNKPMWIFWREWCRLRGGAESLSFSWGGLLGSHGGRSRGVDLQK